MTLIPLATAMLAGALPAIAQPRQIDAAKSVLTVHVYKSGLLSAFGHDHAISAPVSGGAVDVQGRSVELRVDAAALRVQDPGVSDKDRAEIQATMLGADVLDAANHHEIHFRSTSVEAAGAGVWKVAGDLTLHGQSHPVSMEVHEKDGRYTGNCRFKITDFGIKPVKAAGGAVRVKDEVQLEFDIQLAR
jgi:polyisoprenoid-binding protein YceI